MTSLTVRNVPEDAKRRFRQVAAAHGRSMEEHLRQMIIEADFVFPTAEPQTTGVRDVTHKFRSEVSDESWVHELVRLANGAGEGVFDVGKSSDIRHMSPKDALAELRRLAGGVGLDLPPRLNTRLEAPEF
jgi:UDP-N-acetyl-D-mannosaminuronic acid transferase (WecB/TagA/CpsF family)